MPSISRIRFTNVVYDHGRKRYIDTIFRFDGYNGILLLENGAGKTVFVQTLIQAVLPRKAVAQRKIQETLQINNSVAHIAVEWILEDQPRRYALTAVSLFLNSKEQLSSQEFAMEYAGDSPVRLETLPFVQKEAGRERPATKEEMASYFRSTAEHNMTARFFSEHDTLQAYGAYLEEHFKIIPSEWNKIAAINETEGGVEAYFNNCRTTEELVDRLLIPTVEEGLMAARSASDGDGNGFVKLFESQREHVKQQMRLEKRIGEMQGILEHMQSYTEVRKAQDEAEQALRRDNGILKSYSQYVRKEKEECSRAQEKILARQQEMEEQRKKDKEVLSACRVASAAAACEEARLAHGEAQRAAADAEAHYRANRTESANLTYARKRRDLSSVESLMAERQAALSQLDADQSQEAQELKALLKENSAVLHGWFQQREHREQETMTAIHHEQSTLKARAAELLEEAQLNQQSRERLQQKVSSGEGRISELVSQQERMEQELFADSVHRDADAQQKEWQAGLDAVQQNLADYQKNVIFYREEGEKAAKRLEQAERTRDANQSELQEQEIILDRIETAAQQVMDDLQKWPHCANIAADVTGLYSRADFFKNQLGDAVVMREKRQQELDRQRRQAHRWLDLYGRLDAFAADPAIVDKVEKWSSEFVFLKSGAEFFQLHVEQSEEKREEVYARYPFWALTLVTMEEDLPHLMQLLAKEADDFFEPVFVLSEREARAIVMGESLESLPRHCRAVVPAHWAHVMENASFQEWLSSMREEAERADEVLQENAREWTELQQSLRLLQSFCADYPFEVYQEKQDAYRILQETQEKTLRQLETDRKVQCQCRQNEEGFREKSRKAQVEKEHLQHCLMELVRYRELVQQHQDILAANSRLLKEIDDLSEEGKVLAREEEELRNRQTELFRDEASAKTRTEGLRRMPYWQDVQDEEVVPVGDRTYEALAETRRRLQSRMEGLDDSRARLEEQIVQAEKDKRRLQEELRDMRSRAETELDETMVYPEGGAAREEQLRRELHALKRACDETRAEAGEKKNALSLQQGILQNEQQRHEREYGAYVPLVRPFQEVREEAERSLSALDRLAGELRREQETREAEGRELDEMIHHLELRNETLGFARDDVQELVLDEASQVLSCQQLSERITDCLQEAETAWERVKACRNDSDRHKADFISYCEEDVHDEKMRRSIVDGLHSKSRYEEYLDWQISSKKRLQNAISLFEEERKSHLEHMEHMLEHMVLHLRSVCDGLQELAAKTRVKVGGTTKDIIAIQLGEWDEAEARSAIRSYLNRLTTEFDSDAYRDTAGQENGKKVHETLEKRLRTQQILHLVLGNRPIKVRCRKATSGNNFSERPYPWEESNKWSGGETWSKNMALFLGCLNYLSEKRCHVRKAKYNTRVVVADNPFGKASSDHVLSPVFFIAEQLGFQIIALTAHQEGNFIRKYFPVVYSCRFADTADHKGRTLVPEQELKTAFFEEHHPESLGRLVEYDQLGLFD